MIKPVKILYLQGVTLMGGAPKSLRQLAASLDKKKFTPLVLLGNRGILQDSLHEQGVETKIIKMGMWRKGKTLPSLPRTLYKIRKVIQQEQVGLIHANTLWDNPYAVVACCKQAIPVICHLRSPIRPDMVKKYFLAKTTQLLPVSQAVYDTIPAALQEKSRIVYNGIDLNLYPANTDGQAVRSEFGIKPKELVIGLVGRLDPLKGQEAALTALAQLKTTEQVKLLLVGSVTGKEKEYQQKLEQQAYRLGISNQVIFTGYRSDIPQLTAAFDIALLPSLHEGFGRVIIEAMALKKPVVATAVGGIPEIIISGKTGFTVSLGQEKALVEALQTLIDQPALRTTMGAAGYQRVKEKFSSRQNSNTIEQIYHQLLS